VCLPARHTTCPFTITRSMPAAGRAGSAKVPVSRTVAGSDAVRQGRLDLPRHLAGLQGRRRTVEAGHHAMAQGDVADQEAAVQGRRCLAQRVDEGADAIEAEPAGVAAQEVERRGRHAVEDQRRQADAAVPGDDGGHALAHLRGHVRHREEGAIVVGVGVDEARRHGAVGRVDLAGADRPADLADRDDAVPGDPDVGAAPFSAGAVDHDPVANDELHLGHVGRRLRITSAPGSGQPRRSQSARP